MLSNPLSPRMTPTAPSAKSAMVNARLGRDVRKNRLSRIEMLEKTARNNRIWKLSVVRPRGGKRNAKDSHGSPEDWQCRGQRQLEVMISFAF